MKSRFRFVFKYTNRHFVHESDPLAVKVSAATLNLNFHKQKLDENAKFLHTSGETVLDGLKLCNSVKTLFTVSEQHNLRVKFQTRVKSHLIKAK